MAMRNVTLSLHNKQIDCVNLDKDLSGHCGRKVDKLVPKLQKEILLSSNRYFISPPG